MIRGLVFFSERFIKNYCIALYAILLEHVVIWIYINLENKLLRSPNLTNIPLILFLYLSTLLSLHWLFVFVLRSNWYLSHQSLSCLRLVRYQDLASMRMRQSRVDTCVKWQKWDIVVIGHNNNLQIAETAHFNIFYNNFVCRFLVKAILQPARVVNLHTKQNKNKNKNKNNHLPAGPIWILTWNIRMVSQTKCFLVMWRWIPMLFVPYRPLMYFAYRYTKSLC